MKKLNWSKCFLGLPYFSYENSYYAFFELQQFETKNIKNNPYNKTLNYLTINKTRRFESCLKKEQKPMLYI